MKANLICGMILGAGLLLVAGCGTTRPAPKTDPVNDSPKSASVASNLLAEPMSFELDEIIASVPVEGANQPYQNLHVGLTALVTPRTAIPCDPEEVEAALHVFGPRISAAVLKLVTDSPTLSPHKLDHFRDDLAEAAQKAGAQAFARWPHAADCEIEVVVVSLYWTDSSVGRGERVKRSGDIGVWGK